jgi:hypothetical protein
MSKFLNLTGQRFERLLVIENYMIKNHRAYWLCQCDCGNKKFVYVNNLKTGHTKSCGCLNSELVKERNKKFNTYDLSGDYGIGYTLKGEEFYFDLEDYDKIKDYCWFINIGYVKTNININNIQKQIFLHSLIIFKNNNLLDIDHIDGNPLNNRKYNLRICTHQQNGMNMKIPSHNTSGFKGVTWCKDKNKWRAQIKLNQKMIYLGYYKNKEDAIDARIEAEKKYFGEYSLLESRK